MDPSIGLNQRLQNSVLNQVLCRTALQNSVTAVLTVWPGSGYHHLNTLSQNAATAGPYHKGQIFKHIQHQPISLVMQGRFSKKAWLPKNSYWVPKPEGNAKDFTIWPDCSIAILQYEHANSGCVRWCQRTGEAKKKGKCSRSAMATQHWCAEIPQFCL